MIIEKFTRYDTSQPEIFLALKQSFLDEGFEIFDMDEENQEIRFKGYVYHRVRVDLLAQCFDDDGRTLVQMIYSPLLSPLNAQPSNISKSAQIRVLEEIDQKMDSVMDKTGEGKLVSRENLNPEVFGLQDPQSVIYRSRRGKGWAQLLIGLTVALVGSLMSYLHINRIVVLGSTNLWLILAVLGVAVFCFGLFHAIWRRY